MWWLDSIGSVVAKNLIPETEILSESKIFTA